MNTARILSGTPITQAGFMLPKRLLFWGGTGQARVLRPVVEYYGSQVVAVVDRTRGLAAPFADLPLVHDSGSGYNCKITNFIQ